ncbi:flagellar basal body-associated FliL family protein [Marivita sp. GX14005]|uniref:flagellar basal body-associated FliL family protein n=1 Tax=Marivita sp. GX14005 TaxID=2942276 RepID=UPI00201843CD|nr:flagellar basal body-associated FliL family protein [Marivita sp. GX14005]MCL3881695.1 flagellar basal body-associated FliL family protein [Marivita sp. GX14005]
MIKKLFPLVSLLLGLAAGGGAAIFLAPPPEAPAADPDAAAAKLEPAPATEAESAKDTEIVKLPNQFVVPVILNNRVRAMVILSIALEVETGLADQVRRLEPKLRDEFIEELFGLAALGGFKDELISRKTLELVKDALSHRAKAVLGGKPATILVTDMARQDLS